MQIEKATRTELYRRFLNFIADQAQTDRRAVNRRMLSVFLWCFLAPVVVAITWLSLVKFGVLPRRLRPYADWMGLVFPITYSIYFLGSEALRGVPTAVRRGGVASVLKQAEIENDWKTRVTRELSLAVPATVEDWQWLLASFRGELSRMLYRSRYLTALAGAVLFLIMQGIDAIDDSDEKVTLIKQAQGFVEVSSYDLKQFVGLGLFLGLLYLSSSQSFHYLKRYENCAELLELEKRQERGRT